MVRTRQPTLEHALDHINEEINIVQTEHDAFKKFHSFLYDLQISTGEIPNRTGTHKTLAEVRSSPAPELQEIRQRYREIIMGMPHYDEDYNDTFKESLAEELGGQLAECITENQRITPEIQNIFITATRHCVKSRDGLLSLLCKERRYLSSIADELNQIEASVHELNQEVSTDSTSTNFEEVDKKLNNYKQTCADLATQRQNQIHDWKPKRYSGIGGGSLSHYLYRDLNTLTPALSDIASCLSTIQCAHKHCLVY